jgi:riboflavin synthase
MFTGLVRAVGTVREIVKEPSGFVLEIEAADLPAFAEGSSVSVMGCCQTVIGSHGHAFRVRAMEETLRRTTLGGLKPGSKVNLEPSLRAEDEIGGHLVTGHIDGVAEVLEVLESPTQNRVALELPRELSPLVAFKGSVCVDGVSLTAGEVEGDTVLVYLIPYTLEHTVASDYRPGSRVNIEVDILARYVARLMEARR